MSKYDKKSPARKARKRCDKCKRYSWVAKPERRCWRDIEVVHGLNKPFTSYCGGTLRVVKRKKKAKPAADLPSVAEHKRKKAARQRLKAAVRVKSLQTRIKRLQTALKAQQRRVVHYARLATRSDAEIAAAQERIKVAQQVRTATRRLLRAAGVGNSDPDS